MYATYLPTLGCFAGSSSRRSRTRRRVASRRAWGVRDPIGERLEVSTPGGEEGVLFTQRALRRHLGRVPEPPAAEEGPQPSVTPPCPTSAGPRDPDLGLEDRTAFISRPMGWCQTGQTLGRQNGLADPDRSCLGTS